MAANYSDLLLGSDTLSLMVNTRHISYDEGSFNYYLSGKYSFPVGSNTIYLGDSNSKSGQTVSTRAGEYSSKTNQLIYNAAINHVLYRARQDKFSTSFELNQRRSKCFFDGQIVDVCSRPYTDVSAGLQYVTLLVGNYVYADIKYNKGMPWFGGEKAGLDDKERPVYLNRWLSNISLSRSFTLGDRLINFISRVIMQYSSYHLIDIYSMMIGDEYTVRGFRNSDILGNSGIYLNNTLKIPVESFMPLQITPFVGYDIGYVHKTSAGQNTLTGMAVGGGGDWGNISFSLTSGIPLTYGNGLKYIDPFTFYYNSSYSL